MTDAHPGGQFRFVTGLGEVWAAGTQVSPLFALLTVVLASVVLVSLVLLLVFVIANIRVGGMVLVAVGIALN